MKRRTFVPAGRVADFARDCAHPETFVVSIPRALFSDYEITDLRSAALVRNAIEKDSRGERPSLQPLTKWVAL